MRRCKLERPHLVHYQTCGLRVAHRNGCYYVIDAADEILDHFEKYMDARRAADSLTGVPGDVVLGPCMGGVRCE